MTDGSLRRNPTKHIVLLDKLLPSVKPLLHVAFTLQNLFLAVFDEIEDGVLDFTSHMERNVAENDLVFIVRCGVDNRAVK